MFVITGGRIGPHLGRMRVYASPLKSAPTSTHKDYAKKKYANNIPLLPAPIYLPTCTYFPTIDGLFVGVFYFQFQPSLKLNLPRLKSFQPEFQVCV